MDTTYEYVESPPKSTPNSKVSVKYDTASENITTDPPLTHFSEERTANVHYHDMGPNTSKPPELPARKIVGAQVHEQNEEGNIYHYAEPKLNYDKLETDPSLEFLNSMGVSKKTPQILIIS